MDNDPRGPARRGMSGCGWASAGCGLCILAFVLLIAVDALFNPRYREQAERRELQRCLTNVKLTSFGLVMYLQDYDDRFPPASTWMDQLLPYVKIEGDFHCPAAGGVDSGRYGYAFSSKLAGKTLKEIGDPASRILIYDSTSLHRNASDPVTTLPNPRRHLRWNNISYADGHARSEKRMGAAP
jgi:prepilin-type processing-associated H-X9-DG protein